MEDLIKLAQETKKLTALIVEDRADDNKLMQTFFGNLFKSLYSASSGKEGLEIYKDKKPDVVITDLIMPDMDGLEMTEEIKKIKEDQIIVVVSASDDIEKVTKTVSLNVTSFVHKPIETKKLIDSMSTVVEKVKKNKTIETKSFTVTIPLDMYEMVDEAAKDERISKNGIIIRALKEHFGEWNSDEENFTHYCYVYIYAG